MQVIAHMMPDLPNVGWERDLESFAEFFENPAFRSDGLKVAPSAAARRHTLPPCRRRDRCCERSSMRLVGPTPLGVAGDSPARTRCGEPACFAQVYPTLVIRGTGLYELWKTGLYRNYDPRLLVDLVARLLALVPPWVRSVLQQSLHCVGRLVPDWSHAARS